MTKKTVFITVPEASSTRNLLRGTFWRTWRAQKDIRTVLIVSPEKADSYRREFGGDGVVIESLYIAPSTTERAFAFVARNMLPTGTTTFNQMRQYVDHGGIIGLIAKRILWRIGRHAKILQRLLHFFELRRKPDVRVSQLFDQYRPIMLFSTVAIHAEIDMPILREAKRRGVKTVGMLRGWDNLTTHGVLRIVPDLFLLQNQYLKNMGLKYHFLDPAAIKVVGFPQNDWYFRKDLIESRETFLGRLGIDPQKRVILYGAMGDFLFPREGELAEVFEELAESKKIPSDLIFIFRAHPAFISPLERMKNLKHVVPDRNARYDSTRVEDWEMGDREMAYLMNSIVHSEMTITSGSTMALDAIALGKPAISAAFEKTPIQYWISARRFRRHYDHYEALMATGGVATADNAEKLAQTINMYLADPDMDKAGREMAKNLFLEPMEGRSGVLIAEILSDYLKTARHD